MKNNGISRAASGGPLPRPNPEVVADTKRRTFTAEYKLRIVAEADAAATQPRRPGEEI